ncbi:hypothetical protein GGX14DRAFT_566644 [Mycena pura]|uniref:Uncharacterized protein n=1 Tax=Mycena pura TaxID=153505 RepID=A0AAD6YAU1_9AGAR|nr:hypothetical protein GGX14DRAFT_566644 [Mycena pura]
MDPLPNQTGLIAPYTDPLFVTLGVGIQNYTCNSTTSNYASIGTVASLFDISCLRKSDFTKVQTKALKTWKKASAKTKATSIGATVGAPSLLGFVASPSGTGLSPNWDLTSLI